MAFWDRFKRQKKSDISDTDRTEPVLHLGEPPVKNDPTLASPGFRGIVERIQTQLAPIAAQIKSKFPKNMEDLRRLQSDENIARMRKIMSGKAYGTYIRLGAATFMAYFLADTVSLITDVLVPEPPPVPPVQVTRKEDRKRTIEEYAQIPGRNIFNSKGLIPDETNLAQGPARKSMLPLNLIGTVVLQDELKSIAAIEDKSQNLVYPVRVDDTVNDKVKITKIEHLKVYFINKATGHLEYIEIVEDMPLLNTQALRPTPGRGGGGITSAGDTKFEIERSAVDKAVGNLSEVLQQARAIPNYENGVPDGYKIIQIVPGSIYDQLGIKNNDVITSLNGDPLSDPGKAFQLFNDLKSINHVEIGVKRGGQRMTLNYDIR